MTVFYAFTALAERGGFEPPVRLLCSNHRATGLRFARKRTNVIIVIYVIVSLIGRMASIRRKPETKFWFACFTDGGGIQRQRSTKTTNKRDALRMAEAFEEAYRTRQRASQMRRVMSDIHEDMFGDALSSLTFGEWVKRWRKEVTKEYKTATLDRIDEVISATKKVSPEMFDSPIDRIERVELIELRNRLAETRAVSTVNTMMRLVKGIFRGAWQSGLISDNPAGSVPALKKQEGDETGKPRRAFTMAEIKAVLAVADGEWRDIIYVGLYSAGQRLGDICRMTPAHVDLEAQTMKFKTGKTGRWVILPVVDQLAPILTRRIKDVQPDCPLFPTAFGRVKGGKVNQVSNAFRRLLYKAGLATHPKHTKRVLDGKRRASNELSFHSLRHSATSLLVSAGVSRVVAMDLVGHASEAVSEHYTKIDDATKRAALGTLPDLG